MVLLQRNLTGSLSPKVGIYQSTLHNVPEELRCHQQSFFFSMH